MSEFTSQGGEVFPNTYSDLQTISEVAEWPIERLNHKANEYGKFLLREDLMPRALKAANFIMDRLLFEMAYRDGVYDPIINKVEDEICEAA